MPINATAEFYKAQSKFLAARTREEKIAALEEMLATAPAHKGAEHLRAQIKAKLAKLRRERESRAAGRSLSIPKEGDVQVCIIGLTQSGKSTLLAALTNAKPKISNIPFTTKRPEIGCAEWHGIKMQLIEIPSTFEKQWLSIARNADSIVIVIDGNKNVAKERFELDQVLAGIKKPMVTIITKTSALDTEKIKENIWRSLGMIRVYTCEGGRPSKRPLVLKKGATVKDVASSIHKDFLKFFKYAKIWGTSVKYPGERVGLSHVLKDGDIVEIKAG